MKSKSVVLFEISVQDMAGAQKFYEAVLASNVEPVKKTPFT